MLVYNPPKNKITDLSNFKYKLFYFTCSYCSYDKECFCSINFDKFVDKKSNKKHNNLILQKFYKFTTKG